MTLITALLLPLVLTAELPLSVSRITASPTPEVVLRNTGSQPINAWAFAITWPNPEGGIHRVFHSADVYMSEVTGDLHGAAPHLQRLMPSQARAVPVASVSPAGRPVALYVSVSPSESAPWSVSEAALPLVQGRAGA